MITYYLVLLVIFGVWYGGYRLWRRHIDEDVREGAAFEFERLERQEPALLQDLKLPGFTAIYSKVETPRAPAYTLVATAVFFISAPFVLAITAITLQMMERTGIIPQPAEAAQRLKLQGDGIKIVASADLDALQYILIGWGGFFFFFSLLFFWAGAFYVTMRRYHNRRPGSLRDEILRTR